MDKFNEIIKNQLKVKHLSIPRLAKEVNMSIPYLYDLINGNRRWNSKTIDVVSSFLGIQIEFKIVS